MKEKGPDHRGKGARPGPDHKSGPFASPPVIQSRALFNFSTFQPFNFSLFQLFTLSTFQPRRRRGRTVFNRKEHKANTKNTKSFRLLSLRSLRHPLCVLCVYSCAPLAPKIFSNHWKTHERFFQSLEKSARIFQPLEKYFPIIGKPAFPRRAAGLCRTHARLPLVFQPCTLVHCAFSSPLHQCIEPVEWRAKGFP